MTGLPADDCYPVPGLIQAAQHLVTNIYWSSKKHHNCALHAANAAENVWTFPCHQTPSSLAFRGCLHVVKEQSSHRMQGSTGGVGGREGSTGRLEDVTWFGWGASWCLLPRRWWGTSCCTAWTASHPAPPGTSQSSRPRRFCTPGSRWWTWGRSSGVRGHRWGWGAAPSERQTKGGHPSRSHPPSPRAGTLARSHSRDGRASGTAGFLHSCSSPVGRSLTVYECAAFHLVCECEDHDPHKLKACFWSHQSPIIR